MKEITDVLNQLNAIKDPILSEYTSNIKMIKVEEDSEEENKNQINFLIVSNIVSNS